MVDALRIPLNPPLVLLPNQDGKTWTLGAAWESVPEGFVTDLASVPWIGRGLVGRWGLWGPASVLHDWHYHRLRGMVSNGEPWVHIARDRAFYDAVYYVRMRRDGVGWRCILIWGAVRVGGWWGLAVLHIRYSYQRRRRRLQRLDQRGAVDD